MKRIVESILAGPLKSIAIGAAAAALIMQFAILLQLSKANKQLAELFYLSHESLQTLNSIDRSLNSIDERLRLSEHN